MRRLAIGDIHGCFQALQTLEQFVGIAEDDLVITLGDYVDRGPDSFAVVDWLMARARTGQLRPLRGNHEIVMLQARECEEDLENWKSMGGQATLDSYSHLGPGELVDVPGGHWDFLQHGLLDYYEQETCFCVHAAVHPDTPLHQQQGMWLHWGNFDTPMGIAAPHQSGKTMICGHASQKNGLPANHGHIICIDTYAHGGGWLTCLDLDTHEAWQANQQGDTRQIGISPA